MQKLKSGKEYKLISYFGHLGYYNIFRRLFIFLKFFFDNIQNLELKLLIIGLKYFVFKSTHRENLIAKTNLGKFELRGGTLDFMTANSSYEYAVMHVFKKEIIDCDVFIDVGANIGIYSIFAGKNCIPTLAFEPIKSNFDAFIKNLKLNNLEAYVNGFNVGLSNTSQKSEFYFSKRNTGASSLYNWVTTAIGEKCKVELIVADDFENESLEKAKYPFIKIDVEGMELLVLEGFKKIIQAKGSLKIIIETKHSGDDTIRQKLSDLGEFRFIKIDAYNLLAIKK